MPFVHAQTTAYNSSTVAGTLTLTTSLTNNPAVGDVVCVAVLTFNSSPTVTVQDDAGTPNVYIKAPNSPSNAKDTTAGSSWLFYGIADGTFTKNIVVTLSTNPSGVFGVYVDDFTVNNGSAFFAVDAVGSATAGASPTNTPTAVPVSRLSLAYAHGAGSAAFTGVTGSWVQNNHGLGAFSEDAAWILGVTASTVVQFTTSGAQDYDTSVMVFGIDNLGWRFPSAGPGFAI
jgi:hypothetical protein